VKVIKIEYQLLEQRNKRDRPAKRGEVVKVEAKLKNDGPALVAELDRILANAASAQGIRREHALLSWKRPWRTDWREHR
jgi:hypothetical protein